MSSAPAIIERTQPYPGYVWPGALILQPEGLFGGQLKTDSDEPVKITWQDLNDPWHTFFTKEFIVEAKRETMWIPADRVAPLTSSEDEAVGRGLSTCPRCNGFGWMWMDHWGETTHLYLKLQYTCPCASSVTFWRFWGNRENVPERFTQVTLKGLRPSNESFLSIARQEEVIRQVQDHPGDSYLMIGPPGTGKSHIAYALLRRAVRLWARRHYALGTFEPAVWSSTAYSLLNSITQWKMAKANYNGTEDGYGVAYPKVMPNMIRSAANHGERPVLLLDELDKFTVTDAKLNDLNELVGATWDAKGQLLGVCNKDVSGLNTKWKDDDLVGSIIRRIGAGEGAHILEFR